MSLFKKEKGITRRLRRKYQSCFSTWIHDSNHFSRYNTKRNLKQDFQSHSSLFSPPPPPGQVILSRLFSSLSCCLSCFECCCCITWSFRTSPGSIPLQSVMKPFPYSLTPQAREATGKSEWLTFSLLSIHSHLFLINDTTRVKLTQQGISCIPFSVIIVSRLPCWCVPCWWESTGSIHLSCQRFFVSKKRRAVTTRTLPVASRFHPLMFIISRCNNLFFEWMY